MNKIIKKTKQVIKEIFGRISSVSSFASAFYGRSLTEIDVEKNDYDLTKSIFYATPFHSESEGEKFIFGASFGKPIVNSITAFALAEPLSITCENEQIKEEVNNWLKEQHGQICKGMRNAIRDGDCYLSLDGEEIILTAPSQVKKITDPLHNGKVIGYDIEVKQENEKVYLTKIRETKPYKEVIEFEDQNATDGKVIQRDETINLDGIEIIKRDDIEEVVITGTDDKKLLSMIAFVNEKEPEMKYGMSEYQNCYYLMSAYHDVLSNAIKNNIYNGTATPYLSAEDIDEFLALNFDKDDKGEYQLKWTADKMIVGGKDMKAGFMEAPKTQAEANILLRKLFYLICQASETPEFLMGTAVQGSRASVETQMPIVIKKAMRKQEEFKKYIKELVSLYLQEKGKSVEFNLVMPEVVSEKDLKMNKEIAGLLLEHGCITRKTANIMLEIDNFVDDVDSEVEEADKESTERLQKADVYGFDIKKKIEQPTEIPVGGGTQKEMKEFNEKIKETIEKEKKNVKEMIEEQNNKIKKVEKFKDVLEKALEKV